MMLILKCIEFTLLKTSEHKILITNDLQRNSNSNRTKLTKAIILDRNCTNVMA